MLLRLLLTTTFGVLALASAASCEGGPAACSPPCDDTQWCEASYSCDSDDDCERWQCTELDRGWQTDPLLRRIGVFTP